MEFHSHIYEYTGMHILCRLDTTSNSLRSNSVLLEKPSRELEVRLVAPPAFYKKNKKTLTDICAMAKNKNKTFNSSHKDVLFTIVVIYLVEGFGNDPDITTRPESFLK